MFPIRRYIKREYGDPEVIITENGWPDDGRLNDSDRIVYLGEHLKEILKVARRNECNVTGYTGKEDQFILCSRRLSSDVSLPIFPYLQHGP